MTQQEIDQERKTKEKSGIKTIEVTSPSGTLFKVFADGTAYALGGTGGRYVKFHSSDIWNYDAPGASIQYSHAHQKWTKENELFNNAWKRIQQ